MKRSTLTIRPIQADGDGRRENSGRNSGACAVLAKLVVACEYLMTPHLVEDAAIVWVESAFIKKETFLHYIPSAIAPDYRRAAGVSLASPHTSLEAIDGRRYFHSSREQVREAGKGHGKEDSKGGGGGEDGCLWVVPIDLPDRVHIDSSSRIIVVWSSCA